MSLVIRLFSLLVVTVFSVIIFSTPITANTISQPIPLRAMYLKSDLILIGTVSQTGQWEMAAEKNSEATYRRILTINVESSIKGAAVGEIAVSEIRGASEGKSSFAVGQRRLFFLADTNDSYFLLSNFHGDLALSERDLQVYAARLGELQNIYLSGGNTGEVINWLAAVAADPVTRFDGAYDLELMTDGRSILDPLGRDGGSFIDPFGRTLNASAQNRDHGSCLDPLGGPCASRGDQGSGTDPDGRSSTEESDVGSRLDPNGKRVKPVMALTAENGGHLDPNGRTLDQGGATDPDGRAKGEQGPSTDPDGKSSIYGKDDGRGIDPNGRGPLIDPDGHGSSMDPNGKGLGVDPNGKSSIFGKDDGRGIDPNGRGFSIDPNGKGMGLDPNGKGLGVDPNGKGMGVDPNGKGWSIDPNGAADAGPRIDPEGRTRKSTRSPEAGVIIDPNGRGVAMDPNGDTDSGPRIDPNGKPGDDKDAGVRIDPEGRGAGLDPNGKPGDSGPATDPNGKPGDSGSAIDPDGKAFSAAWSRKSGTSIDPSGRDSGTSLDPSGRAISAANREKLMQAFLAINFSGAALSDGDLALLHVVSIGDAQLEKLARLYILTFRDASKSGVDEWDGEVVKRDAEEWDSDVVKRDAVDQWDSDIVKITAAASKEKRVDEWDSEVVKRGLSGDALRIELLRLIRARVQLLALGE
jgi:hypothetical protein